MNPEINALLDPVANFGKVTISTGYGSLDTVIVLGTGDGSKLPDPSTSGAFNLVWYNSTDYPDPSDDANVEIVRCTDNITDVLTVTRAQEGTAAKNHNLPTKTYKMILAPTKKMFVDIPTDAQSKVNTHATLLSTHGVTGNIVGTTDIQTLTNKIISGDNNTLRNIDLETSIKQNTFSNQSFQNLLKNGNFEFWNAGPTSSPDGWTLNGGIIARDGVNKKMGTYAIAGTSNPGADFSLNQSIITSNLSIDYLRGRTLTFGCWIKTSVTFVQIQIRDGVGVSGGIHSGSGNWEFVTVTRTIDPTASGVDVNFYIQLGTKTAYFDGAILAEGSIVPAFMPHPADVANPWYWRERCLLTNPTDVLISNNTETLIPFTGEIYDVGNMHDNTVNNTRITFPSTGLYLVIGHIVWRSGFTASNLYATLLRGGVDRYETISLRTSGEVPRFEITMLRSFGAGDYIQLLVYQNSGATQTMANEVNFAAIRMT